MRYFIVLLVCFAVSCGEDKPAPVEAVTTNPVQATEAKVVGGTPEEFAQKISEMVIANDYAGLTTLIIQKTEMVELIRESNVTAMGKEAAISHVDVEIQKMKFDTKNGLDEIRASGTTAGIAWENCRFKEAKYTVAQPSGYDMMQLKCILECNGIEHTFTVTDVVHTKHGWRLGGKMMYGDVSTH